MKISAFKESFYNMKQKFALIGAAGYIAPKHMKAIKETGNELVAAIDPHDSVGVIDSYFPNARFFTEIERFDRHLEKHRRLNSSKKVKYISICSPNYLHDAHIRLALRLHAHAICEKPLVINPWNLEALEKIEQEYDTKVYTILQLRYLPAILKLKEQLLTNTDKKAEITLNYITRRGSWYDISWKGNESKSGGIIMNIGIHFFDMLIWLFGSVQGFNTSEIKKNKAKGFLELEHANVNWFLSTDENDLPKVCRDEGEYAFRTLTIDGENVDFSTDFTDLHTKAYEEILAGRGFCISDVRKSIELVYKIRTAVNS